ncbi:MAG: RNA polymerase sigma factor [Roseiflexaceae bacterium]
MSHLVPEPQFTAALTAAYPQLLRVCTALAGNRGIAEDLAQETMLEALRLKQRVYAVDGVERWLAAIARNVWLRWRRQQGCERVRLMPAPVDWITNDRTDILIADDVDLELVLEQHELADLLDRALGLLPQETRDVLIQRFVHNSPYAEIAARLELSEHTAVMRVRRGKLALRRVLSTTLRDEATSYGIASDDAQRWQETAIWCPECGQQRLLGCFVRAEGHFTLRCPHCFPNYRSEPNTNLAHLVSPTLLSGVQGFKPALTRVMAHWHSYYTQALAQRSARCVSCSRTAELHVGLPPHISPSALGTTGAYVACPHCDMIFDLCLKGFALWSPAGRRFWKIHRRIYALPEQPVSIDGRPALLTSFYSATGSARLDMVFAPETLTVLDVAELP